MAGFATTGTWPASTFEPFLCDLIERIEITRGKQRRRALWRQCRRRRHQWRGPSVGRRRPTGHAGHVPEAIAGSFNQRMALLARLLLQPRTVVGFLLDGAPESQSDAVLGQQCVRPAQQLLGSLNHYSCQLHRLPGPCLGDDQKLGFPGGTVCSAVDRSSTSSAVLFLAGAPARRSITATKQGASAPPPG